jgi:hypothetical protein
MAGRELPDGWPTVRPEPRDADLMVDDTDTVEDWLAAYREQIEQPHAVVASMDLDTRCARPDLIECNLRYVLFHLPGDRPPRRPRRHHPRDPRRHPRDLTSPAPRRQYVRCLWQLSAERSRDRS